MQFLPASCYTYCSMAERSSIPCELQGTTKEPLFLEEPMNIWCEARGKVIMSLNSLPGEEAVQTAVWIGVQCTSSWIAFSQPNLFPFNRQHVHKTCNALQRCFLIGVFELDASEQTRIFSSAVSGRTQSLVYVIGKSHGMWVFQCFHVIKT